MELATKDLQLTSLGLNPLLQQCRKGPGGKEHHLIVQYAVYMGLWLLGAMSLRRATQFSAGQIQRREGNLYTSGGVYSRAMHTFCPFHKQADQA